MQSSSATPGRAPLMALETALEQLLAAARPSTRVERVATWDADGRVLAADLVSELQVPAQDSAAMDGYAVRVADLSAADQVLPLSQRIAAGQAAQPLRAGTCARIFTGAPMPCGADAVVMQEDTRTVGGNLHGVHIQTLPTPGQWVRRAGEDVARGAVVLPRGTRLSPASLGLAASIGLVQLPLCARLRVALFSTGDELVMPGDLAPQQMPPGAIYNSNRFFLRALLQRLGCAVSDLGIVPDQRAATQAALETAANDHDLILSSGGVSVGEEDHVKPAVQQLGRLDLWQIAMKPGKPFAYGSVRRGAGGDADACHFIGLPGNPVSAFVTFLLLVRPFLLKLQGALLPELPVSVLPAHFDLLRAERRREFLRVRRNAAGGLDLFANQSSGVLSSLVWGDGLLDHAAGHIIERGDPVRFIAFADLLH